MRALTLQFRYQEFKKLLLRFYHEVTNRFDLYLLHKLYSTNRMHFQKYVSYQAFGMRQGGKNKILGGGGRAHEMFMHPYLCNINK